jgi:multidrug efflux pump subunit AcrA (membrane-fusion protein)
VEAVIPNPSQALKPGLFARVTLYSGPALERVVTPVTSLLYEGQKTKVFLVPQDRARERFVKVGRKYGEVMEVLEGLGAGEPVVVVGQNNLTDGMKVHVAR